MIIIKEKPDFFRICESSEMIENAREIKGPRCFLKLAVNNMMMR